MVPPPVIAPIVRNSMGVVLDVELSEVYWIGLLILFEIKAVAIRRIEYAAVIIVASKNITTINIFD